MKLLTEIDNSDMILEGNKNKFLSKQEKVKVEKLIEKEFVEITADEVKLLF